MEIQLNGEILNVRARSTLADLVRELALAPARVAIELNQMVVRRADWAETVLNEGDRIEIVHFVGGGCEAAENSGSNAGRILRFSIFINPGVE